MQLQKRLAIELPPQLVHKEHLGSRKTQVLQDRIEDFLNMCLIGFAFEDRSGWFRQERCIKGEVTKLVFRFVSNAKVNCLGSIDVVLNHCGRTCVGFFSLLSFLGAVGTQDE